MIVSRRIVSLASALLVLAAASIAFAASPASAASRCSYYGQRYFKLNGIKDDHLSVYLCSTYQDSTVWYGPNTRSNVNSGVLYKGANWFSCQVSGGANPRVGSATNHWWLFTRADRIAPGTDGWGWVPATKVSQGANNRPVPGVPTCKGALLGGGVNPNPTYN
jgi:hypothetical protein